MPSLYAYGDGGCLVSAPAELAGLFCRGAVQQRKRTLVAATAVAAAAAECVRAAKKQRQQLPLPLPSLDALPDECLFEILRRVPGGRGRGASACVSRRWLALLGSIRASELGQAAADTERRDEPATTVVACRVTAGATGLLSTALDDSYYTAAPASMLLCRKEKRKGAYPILRLQRYSIVSTGGTASSLEAAGVSATKVEEITHFPEMLDGRVKTLHPSVHGGILARRDQEHHLKALRDHGIGTFDVVVVNLYPFYDKVTSGNISFEDGIETIDIGGPTMIRAAAKNHKDVLIVVDHNDYPALLEYLKGNQEDQQFRRMLAWKAFQHVASYDSAVSEWFWKQSNKGEMFPPSFTVPLELKSTLRYGENPHQSAAFYTDKSLSRVGAGGIGNLIQHHGKEMSYNNYLDADAAWNCVSEFDSPTCVVVKHTNPCGVASRQDILEAYRLAVKGDAVSAFGGIVAFNTIIDEDLAKEIREFRSPTDGQTRMFYEIVVAPGYTDKGLEILRGKSKTLRILEAKRSGKGMLSLRQVSGGWLAQESDDLTPEEITFTTKSERSPQENELADAKFAWLCAKHVKSNAIVIAKNNCMLGMGSGQPNRRESVRIAFRKAGEEAKGAALASDAFFPFAWNDAVEEACQNGIGIIAQPGGSKKDKDAIACCNKYGVSLVLTGVRHFKH